MCGIAGIVYSERHRPEAMAASIQPMTDALAHRGPDGAGIWKGAGIVLGHRRLSIIDLAGGTQPMIGPSGSVIVFNGEIYNYRELRTELESRGHRFATDSDTEVLLAGFERWGDKILDRLVGMFAFAIWEPDKKRLFLARDRLGKKPLFYFEGPDFFAFASELKSLLTLDEVRQRVDIDPLALSDYLSLGYVLTPRSILKGVVKLPAGHVAAFDGHQAVFRAWPYWRLENFVTAERRTYDAAAQDEFLGLLDDAVRLRLRSDVPLAGYMSGGIDSATVMALASRQLGGSLSAYCVGFADPSFDEYDAARRTAEHLGVNLARLPCQDMQEDELGRLVDFCDEPFADTSQIPTFQLNREAKRHTTVALTGDGADECLAGYSTYRADVLHRYFRMLPGGLRRMSLSLGHNLFKPSYRKVSFDYKLRRFLASGHLDAKTAHCWWRTIFNDEEKRRLLTPDALQACAGYEPSDAISDHFKPVAGASFLDQCLYVDIKTWLQDDILVKADRMSMANGIEVRSPFLDHRLVEFLAGLEPSAKMAGLRQKRILRQAMRPLLPNLALNRGKQGFNAPVMQYGFRTLTCRDFPEFFRHDLILDPRAEDITFKSFALGMLDIWLKKFADYKRGGAWEIRT